VELTFEYPTRDRKSGLEVDAGTQIVDGATALAYVRSRSTEELRDGEWRDAEGGDIARTGRQREVLRGVIGRALSPGGAIRSPAVIAALQDAIRVDEGTRSWYLAWFGVRFQTAGTEESMALPVSGSSEGGVSFLVRDDPAAATVIERFVAGDPLPLPEDEG
jgi:anionic cell wall polymer biosynthesis LytR-Cps2A-Psr (LCP) family protein